MGSIPVLKPREVIGFLERLGFREARQRGSHKQFRHADGRTTTVPFHAGHDISPTLLRKIARDVGLTVDELLGRAPDDRSNRQRNRGREIQEQIRLVLLRVWDPIGVADVPEAQDEYDSYVGGIYRLLARGATDDELADQLWRLETETMGLGDRDRNHLVAVIKSLRSIDVKL